MSFILDALRKSEHERQRQAGPGIAELRAGASSARWPLWAIGLGLLLLINLVFVIILVLRKETAPTIVQAPTPAEASVTSQPASVVAASTSAAATPSANSSQGAPLATTAATMQAPQPPAMQPAVSNAAPEEARARSAASDSRDPGPVTRADPQLRASAPAGDVSDAQELAQLPTLNDVILKGDTAIPQLHLDLHRYAPRPADRFVFINSAKYREGAQTPDGTTIERITRDGVVLNHRGVRFFLPLE